MLCLQPLNLPEKKVNLVSSAPLVIPIRLLHRGARSAKRKGRRKIFNIKPDRLPVDDLVTQIIGDILGFPPLTKLQAGSPNYIHLGFVGMRFQMKEILKQIEVGLNPQKGLAQVDKDRDMEDGIRGQVMHLNPQ